MLIIISDNQHRSHVCSFCLDLNIKHLNSLLTTKQNILWENKRPFSGYTENYSYFKLVEDKSPIDSISQVIIESIDNENNLIGRLS